MITITKNALVGHQERPDDKDHFFMFYMMCVMGEDNFNISVRKLVVEDGDGFDSVDDILSSVPVSEEFKFDDSVPLDLQVARAGNQIAMKSRRGVGKLVSDIDYGKFVIYSGEHPVDRPIFSYTTDDGKTKFIKSPNFDNLVIRIA